MKVTVYNVEPGEEEEIIVRCARLDEDMVKLLNRFKQGDSRLKVGREGQIYLLEPEEFYYFESVDQRVFAYAETLVYETKSRLYELEKQLPEQDFLRASKSTIINLNRIESLKPALGGRFEARLKNGEKVIISRQYVGLLKEKLGL